MCLSNANLSPVGGRKPFVGRAAGRYVTNAADATVFKGKELPVALGLDDQFLARRFVRDITRGSVSQGEFWDLLSGKGGKLTEAAGTLRAYAKSGDDVAARTLLAKSDPAIRRSLIADVYMSGTARGAHPLIRAQAANGVISDMRQDVRAGTLAGPRAEPIILTAQQRREADDALAYLAMTEMQNGFIAAGIDGWEGKAMVRRSDAMDRLAAVSPTLPPAVNAAMLRAKVLPTWPPRSSGSGKRL